VLAEGNDAGEKVPLLCIRHQPGEERLVTQVHPVKHADSQDGILIGGKRASACSTDISSGVEISSNNKNSAVWAGCLNGSTRLVERQPTLSLRGAAGDEAIRSPVIPRPIGNEFNPHIR